MKRVSRNQETFVCNGVRGYTNYSEDNFCSSLTSVSAITSSALWMPADRCAAAAAAAASGIEYHQREFATVNYVIDPLKMATRTYTHMKTPAMYRFLSECCVLLTYFSREFVHSASGTWI
jgi:hypothetical protein